MRMQLAGVAAAVILVICAGANVAGADADGQDLKLWYRQPAKGLMECETQAGRGSIIQRMDTTEG